MADSPFSSQTVALRVQKKLLSKISNKSVASLFVDDKVGRLLDSLHAIAKLRTERKDADRTLRHLIKVVVKVGLLLRQGQGQCLSPEEVEAEAEFRRKFKAALMTAVSFHELDFSLDAPFLSEQLTECHGLIRTLTERHMTDKNKEKLDGVFSFFGNEEMIDAVFKEDKYADILGRVVCLINELAEAGSI